MANLQLTRRADNLTTGRFSTLNRNLSSNSLETNQQNSQSRLGIRSISSSPVMSAQSAFSNAVDEWFKSTTSRMPLAERSESRFRTAFADVAVQSSRYAIPLHQQGSNMPFTVSNMWYMLVMAFTVLRNLRCSQSTLQNTAENFLTSLQNVYDRLTQQMHTLIQAHSTSICATCMDLLLLTYALGFLVLSLCHALLFTSPT